MSASWGERMASVVAACGPRPSPHGGGIPYHRRLEKVKFGVPLDQVCKRDIPGPLLVMLLKLNKEGPFKKDVFRAPGHQGNMRKLVHFLQQGRLVNIHSFSVNTIASVLKKFLRKIPGGIFGPENEAELFKIIKMESAEEKLKKVQRVFDSLPIYSQHLLVLLFGTFRVIHSNCEKAKTGMTAEALGVSVAPSFFHTCVSTGKTAKMEDVERFKLATKVTTFFIEHFGIRELFGRENYEYYARLTGRILRVEDEWIFFTYPPQVGGAAGGGAGGGGATPSGLSHQVSRDDMDASLDCLTSNVERGASGGALEKTGSLEIIPENCTLDPQGRLSISLDDQNVSSPSSCGSPSGKDLATKSALLAAARNVAAGAHGGVGGPGGRDSKAALLDFRSHTLGRVPSRSGQKSGGSMAARNSMAGDPSTLHVELPQVHQIQTERMKHRSEWFLSDPETGMVTVKCGFRTTGSAFAPLLKPTSESALEECPAPAAVITTTPLLDQLPLLPGQTLASSPPGQGGERPPPPPPFSPLQLSAAKPASSLSSPIACDKKTQLTPTPGSALYHPSPLAASQALQQLQSKSKSFSSSSPPQATSPPAGGGTSQPTQSTVQSSSGQSPPGAANNTVVSLRRRLSDKDKERRLVRRSSSKKKDKENGGGAGGGASVSPAHSLHHSKERIMGSSGALHRQHSSSDSSSHGHTPPSSLSGHHLSGGGEKQDVTLTPIGSRPMLKRAGSADASGGGYSTVPGVVGGATSTSSPRHSSVATSSHHAALCRTGSQDTPHQQPSGAPSSVGPLPSHQLMRAKSGSESPLTRSLPRI